MLSGPSGAGKTELMRLLKSRASDLRFCVTATTRKPRPGEQEGVDYHFFQESDFMRLIDEGKLLEYARVPPETGYYYGTPRDEVEPVVEAGRNVLTQADVQGARSLRAQVPTAVLIFLKPPDLETLRRRLVVRGAEEAPEMQLRLANAVAELGCESEFDYSVVNADGALEAALEQLQTIIKEASPRGAASA